MNINYLNQLRDVAKNYQLTDKCIILRQSTEMDTYGGVEENYRVLGEYPCRFILQSRESNVRLSGGSINLHAEYDVILPNEVILLQTDLIKKKNDPYDKRTFEIIKTDNAMSDGLFSTISVKERMD